MIDILVTLAEFVDQHILQILSFLGFFLMCSITCTMLMIWSVSKGIDYERGRLRKAWNYHISTHVTIDTSCLEFIQHNLIDYDEKEHSREARRSHRKRSAD